MIVTIMCVSVMPEKQHEFEQTVVALRDSFQNEKDCMHYDVFKQVEGMPQYSLIGSWRKRDAADRHFSSGNFSVLSGAVKNLCDPPEIRLRIADVLKDGDNPEGIPGILNRLID